MLCDVLNHWLVKCVSCASLESMRLGAIVIDFIGSQTFWIFFFLEFET